MFSTNKWIKIYGLLAFVGCAGMTAAQDYRVPLYEDVLYLRNIYSTSSNPTSISFAPLDLYTDIDIYGGISRGDYHDVDQSSKINGLGIDIKGLKKFKRAACFGSIGYDNSKAFDRCWNSTLFISPDNPYILADSVRGDFNKEIFTLKGIASYNPTQDWTLALGVKYLVGSTSDQTDPRAETVGMRFSLNPGVTWQFSRRWSAGVSGEFELFKEKVSHTIVNTRASNVFLRLNGMGFCDGISTDSPFSISYTRDYNGFRYGAAVQFAYTGTKVSDFIEAAVDIRSERARDGGRTVAYKGGDYDRLGYGLKNRLSIQSDHMVHNITLAAAMGNVEGMYYTQELRRDQNKNNEQYYFTLDSAVAHTVSELNASIEYRMDILSGSAPTLSWYVGGALKQSNTEHIYYDTYHMNYTRLTLNAGVEKHFSIKKSLLNVGIDGEYAMPLANDDYEIYDRSTLESDGSYRRRDRMPEQYIYPQYEYASGSYAAVGLKLSTHIPVQIKSGYLWLGVSAQARAAFYMGNSVYRGFLGEELNIGLRDTHFISSRIALDVLF